jgi:16S rRNA U516 pseudouridylate synthase RsuA-like enzyme
MTKLSKPDLRKRISITLTDGEARQVKDMADLLGIKSTRLVYEALKLGMPILLDKTKKDEMNLRFFKQEREMYNR